MSDIIDAAQKAIGIEYGQPIPLLKMAPPAIWARETFGHGIPDEALDTIDTILAASEELHEDKVRTLLRKIASTRRTRHIPRDDGKPYMTRYDIHGWMPEDGEDKKYPLSIYLHRFHTPDYDEAPHSHPWAWARSLVLTGGYTERRMSEGVLVESRVKAGDLNRLEPDDYHIITELHGETWTLFSVGPRLGTWGFWVDGKLVPWRERMRQRGLKPEY